MGTDFNRPRFAILNPEMCYTLPKFQIACGVADIMMHTLDRYFAGECNEPNRESEMTDEIAEALLRVTIKYGPIALKSPTDYLAQSELMWCGSLSHNGLTGLGKTPDFSTHQIGHELSGRFDVAHGASLTTVWASWARYSLHINPARFAKYAKAVWGIAGDNAATEGINKTEAFFESLGLPICFSTLGIGIQNDEVIKDMAYRCVHYGARKVGSFNPLAQEDIEAIYKLSNK